jgi:hypothetical protein
MSVPTTDQIYWRAYSKAILTLLTGQAPLGKKDAIYVTPQTQRGIAAGKWIPDVVTNNLLYLASDALLPGDSPLYNPGASASYSQTLNQYLTWVQVNGNPNEGALIRLTNAQNKLNISQDNFDTEQDKAYAKFKLYPKAATTDFDKWVIQNAQKYVAARQQLQAASGAWYQAMTDVFGPDAATVKNLVDRLGLANDIVSPHAGYNMSCTEKDLNDIDALFEASNGGTTPPPPSPEIVFFRPSYSLQGYGRTVEQWVQTFGTNAQKIKINYDIGRDTKWEDLGFSHVEANAEIGYWWIFSVTVHHENTTKTKNLSLSSERTQISTELVVNGIQKFSIGNGAWDVPGVKTMFPTLRTGAPAKLQSGLVKPSALLLAYGVGLNVTFSSDIRTEVDSLFHEASSTGGSARIFGWDISAGGSGSSTSSRDTTFKDVKWDKDSGSLSIPPVDNGFPTLLGVLGSRLD